MKYLRVDSSQERTAPAQKRARRHQFEVLEPRLVLSASSVSAALQFADIEVLGLSHDHLTAMQQQLAVVNAQLEDSRIDGQNIDPAILEANERQIDRAFQIVSDLGQYTADQLALTSQWVIHTFDNVSAESLEGNLGELALDVIGFVPDTYLYTPAVDTVGEVVESLGGNASIEYYYPLVPSAAQAKFLPSDPYFQDQWHLQATGQPMGPPDTFPPLLASFGEDVQITPVWDDYTGDGVVVAIVDDGLQTGHPDLSPNYSAEGSYDFVDGDETPNPDLNWGWHGTAVAGVAAAANNGLGMVGSGFGATLAGIRLLGAANEINQAQALFHEPDLIDVYNNSWGTPDWGYLSSVWGMFGPLVQTALQDAWTLGRDGRGSIHVWAAGNGGDGDNVNYDGYAASRFTIAVQAVGLDGLAPGYAEMGAPVLVSAPSSSTGEFGTDSGIWTTDLQRDDGYNERGTADGDYFEDTDYTSTFGGTSSAAPLVSGIVTLMLEANPTLGARDVMWILAMTARKNDPENEMWVENGTGFLVHDVYGFGVVDALTAVKVAEQWENVPAEMMVEGEVELEETAIPAGEEDDEGEVTPGTLSATISIADNLVVEAVEIDLDITFEEANAKGQLEVILKSPAGTESKLITQTGQDMGEIETWTFNTVRNLGEFAAGTWTVTVNNHSTEEGEFASAAIRVFGHAPQGPSRISGTVGLDLGGDGVLDDTDPPLGGAVVFADLNGNGERNSDEPFALTSSQGGYFFDINASPPGMDYAFTLVVPDGMTVTNAEGNVQSLAVADGDVTALADFALDPDPIVITGTVISDIDADGVRDPFDFGTPGVTVFLDLTLDGIPNNGDLFTTTNDVGQYEFVVDDGPKFYTVGFNPTPPDENLLPTTGFRRPYGQAGTSVAGVNFFHTTQLSSVSGRVFHDLDRDGVLDEDEGEGGLQQSWLYIDLTDDGFSPDDPLVPTNTAGEFVIGSLEAGIYRVRAAGPPDWFQTGPGGDGTYLFTVGAGIRHPTGRNFGFATDAVFDYGDLDGYATLLSEDGPRHPVLPGFFLGEFVDAENDGQPDTEALGDDEAAVFDEDGIVFHDPIAAGTSVRITAIANMPANRPDGYLQAWIDFNRDFVFGNDERVIADALLSDGDNMFTISIPESLPEGDLAFRFRYGEIGIDLPTGPADGGEVEDYLKQSLLHPPDSADFDLNGVVSGDDFLLWQAGFGMQIGAGKEDGDADNDGDVDGDDFLIWQSQLQPIGASGAGANAASWGQQVDRLHRAVAAAGEMQALYGPIRNGTGLLQESGLSQSVPIWPAPRISLRPDLYDQAVEEIALDRSLDQSSSQDLSNSERSPTRSRTRAQVWDAAVEELSSVKDSNSIIRHGPSRMRITKR